MKISALADGENTLVEAPAIVFNNQRALEEDFHADQLNRDLVAVVRFQGSQANGMPELHKLITFLSMLMDRGYKVVFPHDAEIHRRPFSLGHILSDRGHFIKKLQRLPGT